MKKICIFLMLTTGLAVAKDPGLTIDDTSELLDLFNMGFTVKREFLPGNGKLMIQFNAYSMNKKGQLKDRKAQVDDVLLINVINKEIRRVNHINEQPLLLDLPTGRYCVGGVKLTSGRVVPYCKHAFFDVLKNHIEMVGIVTLGVYSTRSGRKDSMRVIDVDKSLGFIDRYVQTHGTDELEKYQASVKDEYPKSFYVIKPYGKSSVYRLFDKDTVEKQSMAANMNTYDRHDRVTYTPDGMVFKRAKDTMRLKGKEGRYSGKVTAPLDWNKYWVNYNESWYVKAERKIQDINMDFNLFNRDFVLINAGFTYSEQDFLGDDISKMPIRFNFAVHKPKYGLDVPGSYKAVNVKVPDGMMSEKMLNKFIDDFEYLRFYLHEKPAPDATYQAFLDMTEENDLVNFGVRWEPVN